MAKLARLVGLASLAALLALAGCADPPWIMSQSPRAIRLRWYPDVTAGVAADEVARLHCSHFGARAMLAASERSGSVDTATWRCE